MASLVAMHWVKKSERQSVCSAAAAASPPLSEITSSTPGASTTFPGNAASSCDNPTDTEDHKRTRQEVR